MKNTGNSGIKKQNVIEIQEQSVDVLYQKMGDQWFAFSLVGDEIFVGSISVNEINGNHHDEASSSSYKS